VKKPAKFRDEFVRTDTSAVRQFTLDGAQREAERLAKRSALINPRPIVTDAGTYFSIEVHGGIRE
jgi:hypothetical protein